MICAFEQPFVVSAELLADESAAVVFKKAAITDARRRALSGGGYALSEHCKIGKYVSPDNMLSGTVVIVIERPDPK